MNTIQYLLVCAVILLALNDPSGAHEAAPDHIIVKYRNSDNSHQKTFKHGKVTEKFHASGLSVLKLNGAVSMHKALTELRQDPAVLYAEPDYIISVNSIPDDKYYSELWGLSKISAPDAWGYTTGSADVIVAVIDTGVDYTHADINSNIYVNKDEIPGNGIDDDNNGFIDDVYGYDFAGNDGDPFDDNSHGTHCAGITGAMGNNGIGVIGVSPVVKIMPVKFLAGNGTGYTSNAIKAIEYAVANGAAVLSCSWGGGIYSKALEDAIYSAGLHGVTVVAAAGNNGVNTDVTPFYPSCYQLDNIISVGASDQNDMPASFSNYGVNSVHIFAPGVNILSLYPGDGYIRYSGTSMATPYAAGTLALYLSFSGSCLPSLLKQNLVNNADRLSLLSKYCGSSARINTGKMIINGNPSPNLDVVRITIRGGDGDNFAESGETLYLDIEIANTGDTLREVTAKLITSGVLLDVLSGESAYPDILPGGKSRNIVPFKIHVKQQSDIYQVSGLVIEVYSGFSGRKERIEVPLYTGNQCTVLLVDDDGGSISESYIENTLTLLGINFIRWDTIKRGVPPLAALNPVMVIWNTGGMQGQVLSPDEIAAVKNYLMSGGSLHMAGDEWADELVSDPLMHDYFKANAVLCDVTPEFQLGASLLEGYSFSLPGILIRRDRLSALSGASMLSLDASYASAGGICLAHTSSVSGPVISSAFDISAIPDAARQELYERLLDILIRPEVISVTPLNNALNIAWRTYIRTEYVEVMIRDSNGAESVNPYYTGSAFISSLANGMSYMVALRAVYSNGMKSEWTKEYEVYPGGTDTSPLPAVTGITSVNGSDGIMFTWNKSADARVVSYNVEVYNSGGRIGFFNTSQNSFSLERKYIGDNDSGTILIYPVNSANQAGIVSQSTWSYTDVYPPDDVIDIVVNKIEQNAIQVTWRKCGSPDLKRYIINVTSPRNMNPVSADSGHVNSVILRNIPDGVSSVITIKCEDLSGNLSGGSTVIWGSDGRGKGNESGMCGCAAEKNKSGDYREAGILPSALNHLVNFIVTALGLVISTIKRFINGRRYGK